ncbi:hypothetical protein BH11PSE11_BH11PSE11_15410 [soil metagenome]
MNGKFLAYGLLVTVLSTGMSWTRFISSAVSGSGNSGSGSGSSWSSTSGSGYSSSGSSHK